MEHHSEAFVALDTAKLRNAVAIADAGRNGEIRYLGEIDNTEAETRKLVAKLASKHARLTFCYEAGPTGYGLYRLIKSIGHDCIVVAPSLIPSKPGDRVKTNRRDAVNLAKLLRAGELTAVWVPDERHEAMRDLVRARDAAVKDYRIKRQNVSSLLLRLGRHYPGKKTWGRAHINWLTSLKLEHREQRIAFEEMLLAVRQVRERIERLEQAMREAVADWTLAPVIEAVQAMRGIDMVGAIAFLAELGDLSRFENPRQLMAYLGLTPSERSTGESVKRGGITKAGNAKNPMHTMYRLCYRRAPRQHCRMIATKIVPRIRRNSSDLSHIERAVAGRHPKMRASGAQSRLSLDGGKAFRRRCQRV